MQKGDISTSCFFLKRVPKRMETKKKRMGALKRVSIGIHPNGSRAQGWGGTSGGASGPQGLLHSPPPSSGGRGSGLAHPMAPPDRVALGGSAPVGSSPGSSRARAGGAAPPATCVFAGEILSCGICSPAERLNRKTVAWQELQPPARAISPSAPLPPLFQATSVGLFVIIYGSRGHQQHCRTWHKINRRHLMGSAPGARASRPRG